MIGKQGAREAEIAKTRARIYYSSLYVEKFARKKKCGDKDTLISLFGVFGFDVPTVYIWLY